MRSASRVGQLSPLPPSAGAFHPEGGFVGEPVDVGLDAVLAAQARGGDVELEIADGGQDRLAGAVDREEDLDGALLFQLGQPGVELLVPPRAAVLDAGEALRREARHRRELDRLALAEGVADGEEPRIDQPDHVAGERLLDRLPVLTEEPVRAGEADRPAQARVEDLHVLLEAPGADPQEGHPVAVARVHVRLDLEDEAGEIGVVRRHRAAVALARGPGAGSSSARASRKGPMPKLVSALPNSTGV